MRHPKLHSGAALILAGLAVILCFPMHARGGRAFDAYRAALAAINAEEDTSIAEAHRNGSYGGTTLAFATKKIHDFADEERQLARQQYLEDSRAEAEAEEEERQAKIQAEREKQAQVRAAEDAERKEKLDAEQAAAKAAADAQTQKSKDDQEKFLKQDAARAERYKEQADELRKSNERAVDNPKNAIVHPEHPGPDLIDEVQQRADDMVIEKTLEHVEKKLGFPLRIPGQVIPEHVKDYVDKAQGGLDNVDGIQTRAAEGIQRIGDQAEALLNRPNETANAQDTTSQAREQAVRDVLGMSSAAQARNPCPPIADTLSALRRFDPAQTPETPTDSHPTSPSVPLPRNSAVSTTQPTPAEQGRDEADLKRFDQ